MLTRNFSRYAHRYDAYAVLQRVSALELVQRLPAEGVTNILEIGCGTGYYTDLLKSKYSHSLIEAWDLSEKMIELARQKFESRSVVFEVTDAEKIQLKDRFDLVTSNAALQWFQNIEESLRLYAEALKKGGTIAFSAFGPLTFRELGWSLKSILTEPDAAVASESFIDKKKWVACLKPHFGSVCIEESIIKEEYPTLMELLKSIKYTGVRGEGAGGSRYYGRGFFADVENVYRNKFGRIEASYQIFYCRAVK